MTSGLVASLVEELRAVGVPVSVGEHLDATRAIAHLPLRSRAVLRAALRCTLVKEASQLATFDLLFDLWTAGGQDAGEAPLAALTDAALRAALREAIRSGDLFLQPLLADEYVRRFAGVEPGRAVAGVRYMLAATQAADLDGIRDDLLTDDPLTDGLPGGGGAGGAGGPGVQGGPGAPGAANGHRGAHNGGGGPRASALRDRLTRAAVDRAIDDFRQLLQSAVRRALVADRGARAVRRTMGVQLAQDKDISGSSAAQSRQIAAAVGPLAQHLARILASQAATRPSRVSIRGTLRRATGTGGVPFSIVTAPPRPPRPEIVVLCDMSGSVSAFSRFTLDLLTAMDSRLSRLRTFAFIDGLDEITGLVREARAAGRPLGTMEAAGAASLSGRSDYGRVMR
ncbi:MAG TPA: VWA domain-containing protein, partial [Trebonia sp.]